MDSILLAWKAFRKLKVNLINRGVDGCDELVPVPAGSYTAVHGQFEFSGKLEEEPVSLLDTDGVRCSNDLEISDIYSDFCADVVLV